MKNILWFENIFWCVSFTLIILLLDGWGKVWRIVPVICLNYPVNRKGK